jgi:excisionase family DNA binding protein
MNRPAFNYKTAAEWLNMKPSKLRRLVDLRKISFVKMGREVRFRQRDLEEYLARCIRPAESDTGLRIIPSKLPPG